MKLKKKKKKKKKNLKISCFYKKNFLNSCFWMSKSPTHFFS